MVVVVVVVVDMILFSLNLACVSSCRSPVTCWYKELAQDKDNLSKNKVLVYKLAYNLACYKINRFILTVALLFLSEYKCHVFVRSDLLSCVIIGDQDYPVRVVFTLMNKVCVTR